MRSFSDRAWTPLGSRPHIFVALPELATLQEAYVRQLAAWWATSHPDDDRPVEQVIRPVPARYLHLTLTWLDRLSSEVTLAQRDHLERELATQLHAVEPVTARFGPAVASTSAIELWVDPDPQLAELALAARTAMRAVFGAGSQAEPTRPWRPHVALAYAADDIDTETLAGALVRAESPPGQLVRPQEVTITRAVLVDNDTFPVDGGLLRWDHDTERPVRLGGRP